MTEDEEQVERVAWWLYQKIVGEERGYDPDEPAWPRVARGWRKEARELLAVAQRSSTSEAGDE